MEEAIRFVRTEDFDGFLAVGGGSVMDTAKVANTFLCHREAELLDFTNAPVGKGMKIEGPLKPLIAGDHECTQVCLSMSGDEWGSQVKIIVVFWWCSICVIDQVQS